MRLAAIYRPSPSTNNGFTVKQFLDEFSTFLEGFVLTPGKLLPSGDFNFHVDNLGDYNTRCFLDVLELFDLKQHISGATHNRGHTLDLVISRAHESGLISAFHVEDPCISDHFAVHCSLPLAKPPLERREISYRKIHTINYDQF